MKRKNYHLHYLKKTAYPKWDAFVQQSPQCCIYGQSWYLEALQRPFKILVAQEGATIYAGIVLTQNRSGDFANPYLGKYLGVYFTDFSGTNYNQESKRRRLIELLITELQKLPSFDYFFHPNFNSYLPFYHQQYDNRVRYSYWLNLKNQSIAELEANFHTKLRAELKYAAQQNYRLDTSIAFGNFFELCQRTFLQKGDKFPFTKEFLTNYHQQLVTQNCLQLVGVRNQNGFLMAVAGLLHFQGVTTLILSGFDKSKMERGANEWLLYQCLGLAKTQSDKFDFEGSMLPKIESFYRKFGGDYVPYLEIYKHGFGRMVFDALRKVLAIKP